MHGGAAAVIVKCWRSSCSVCSAAGKRTSRGFGVMELIAAAEAEPRTNKSTPGWADWLSLIAAVLYSREPRQSCGGRPPGSPPPEPTVYPPQRSPCSAHSAASTSAFEEFDSHSGATAMSMPGSMWNSGRASGSGKGDGTGPQDGAGNAVGVVGRLRSGNPLAEAAVLPVQIRRRRAVVSLCLRGAAGTELRGRRGPGGAVGCGGGGRDAPRRRGRPHAPNKAAIH